MKDVDPLAAIRRRVCELSSKVATKRKVAIGHQPGKGECPVHATAPEIQEAITMLPTHRRSLVSRTIGLGMGIPILLFNYRIYAQPCVSPPNIRAKKAATAASKLPFNMSVTSLRAYQNSGSGKPRYGPPDAPLDSCPLVSAICHEDRDPLTLCPFL